MAFIPQYINTPPAIKLKNRYKYAFIILLEKSSENSAEKVEKVVYPPKKPDNKNLLHFLQWKNVKYYIFCREKVGNITFFTGKDESIIINGIIFQK